MANITSKEQSNVPFRIAASTSVQIIYLNEDRHYDVWHTGLSEAEASATNEVFFGVNGTVPTAAHLSGEELGSIPNGVGLIPIGPGVRELRIITAAGAPTLQFYPSGRYLGR